MTAEEERCTGFHAVDDHPEVTTLLSAMEETARWEARIAPKSDPGTAGSLADGIALLYARSSASVRARHEPQDADTKLHGPGTHPGGRSIGRGRR